MGIQKSRNKPELVKCGQKTGENIICTGILQLGLRNALGHIHINILFPSMLSKVMLIPLVRWGHHITHSDMFTIHHKASRTSAIRAVNENSRKLLQYLEKVFRS